MKITKLVVMSLTLIPGLAFAHPGHLTLEKLTSFSEGLLHPLTSLGHLLAFLMIGIWAIQIKGKSVWSLPITVVCISLVGSLFGAFDIALPYLDQGIILSILLLSLFLNSVLGFAFSTSALIICSVALFQGNSAGMELALSADRLLFGFGWMLSISFLLGIGMAIGGLSKRIAINYSLPAPLMSSR